VTPELWRDAVAAYAIEYLGLGAVFVLGLLITLRQGDVGLGTPRGRRWLALLVGVFFAYAGVHALFQFVLVRY